MDFRDLALRHGISPKGILHLGAHVGQEAEGYASTGVPVVWVEANPDIFPRLLANIARFPGQSAHLAAVSDRDGDAEFFLSTNDGESSSLLRMKGHKTYYPHITEHASIKVRTTTVDSLLREKGLDPARLDFVSMDLQGAEMKALAGMPDHLPHVRHIYTEVNFEELYEGCCLYGDISSFLAGSGFELVQVQEMGPRWGEALFRRR